MVIRTYKVPGQGQITSWGKSFFFQKYKSFVNLEVFPFNYFVTVLAFKCTGDHFGVAVKYVKVNQGSQFMQSLESLTS